MSIEVADNELKDQIVLGLLRLAWQPAAVDCVQYIRKSIKSGRRTALPMLASLCRVDAEACVEMASMYFSVALRQDDSLEKHRGYIPAFIRNFIEVDRGLFRDLIERTTTRNAVSGERLVKLIGDCLSLPVYVRELEEANIASICREIANPKPNVGALK